MHRTESYTQEFQVDSAIKPVVRWLNSTDNVVTLCSCHGAEIAKRSDEKPFVTFICTSDQSLWYIYKVIELTSLFDQISLEVFFMSGTKMYRMAFERRGILRDFVKLFRPRIPVLGDPL